MLSCSLVCFLIQFNKRTELGTEDSERNLLQPLSPRASQTHGGGSHLAKEADR